MSRGLRNNNPGNIRQSRVRYLGEKQPSSDKDFKQFVSQAWGYRAMFVVLHTYLLRYSFITLRQMINRYAPASENETDKYLTFVASRTGIDPDHPLDTLKRETMCPIVAAMSRMENGVEADMNNVECGWRLFLENPLGARIPPES